MPGASLYLPEDMKQRVAEAARVHHMSEEDYMREVAHGAYDLMPMTRHDLADASVAVLAARHHTTRVLTLDQRHFRAMKPLWGDAFTVLPADAN